MNGYVIGIDPGCTGAIAILQSAAQPFKSIGIRAQDYAALDRRLAA